MWHKNELRLQALQQRLNLSDVDAQAQNNKIVQILIQQFDWTKFHCVHCYLPHLKKREINLWSFIAYLFDKQKHISVVSNRINLKNNQIDCCLITPKTQYVLNCFGVEEPDHESQLIDPQEIDLMILPLLACDIQGNRLGYGKGYYDRLLTQCQPDLLRIGVHYFSPLTRTIPKEQHDIGLTGLVTTEKYYQF